MRPTRPAAPAALVALLLAGLAGCGEHAGSPTTPLDAAPSLSWSGARSVQFVHRDPRGPHFSRETVALQARAGAAGEAVLTFTDGTPFARLSLSPESMQGATLNGRRLRRRETVVITLRPVDASRYMVDMQPSGLVFNPDAPAVVEFYYDNAVLPSIPVSVFKQERAGSPWLPAETHDEPWRRVMRGRVDDFTIYALMSGR